MADMADFNLEGFRITEECYPPSQCYQPPRKIQQTVRRETQRRRRITDWHIQGPLPGSWLEKAAKLPGRTLHVALSIWHVYGFNTATLTVLVERFHFNRLGVDKDAARRGLIQLKNAGLITYTKVGQKFKVTILDSNICSDIPLPGDVPPTTE